jgi:predicted membrane metal-binding protein
MAPFAARIFWVCLALFLVGKWKLSKEKHETLCYQSEPPSTVFREAENRTRSNRSSFPRCRTLHKNPGVVQDGRQQFRRQALVGQEAPESFLRGALRRHLETALEHWPGLHALSLSVWLGDLSQFPPWLSERYRAAGLSHLLALSGAHILSLWLCIKGVLYGFAPLLNRSHLTRGLYYYANGFPLLVAALALAAFNPENEPLARAVAMVGWGRLLAYRKMECTLLQQACSACGLLLVMSPTRAASDSFVLSAVSTLLLFCVLETLGKRVRGLSQYAVVSVSMPILLWPLTAFTFGKVSVLAPLNGLLIGWLWGMVWVPLGFVSIFLPSFLPWSFPLLSGLESIWQFSLDRESVWGAWMAGGYWSVVRLTWTEFIVCSFALFWAFRALWNDAPSIDFYRKVGSN